LTYLCRNFEKLVFVTSLKTRNPVVIQSNVGWMLTRDKK
jgi:hypothetical protein